VCASAGAVLDADASRDGMAHFSSALHSSRALSFLAVVWQNYFYLSLLVLDFDFTEKN
jgi:hypothetical protein